MVCIELNWENDYMESVMVHFRFLQAGARHVRRKERGRERTNDDHDHDDADDDKSSTVTFFCLSPTMFPSWRKGELVYVVIN